MKEPALFPVLVHSQDVSGQVLELLPVAALGALSCTCKRLRAIVAAAPRAWQAAAAGEFHSSHPINTSADVQACLRRQHALSTSIAARRCRVVQAHLHSETPQASAAGPSPDHLKFVMARCCSADPSDSQRAEAAEVSVFSALTGQLQRTVSVSPAVTTGPDIWAWDPSSTYILRSFGTAWAGVADDRQEATPAAYSCSGFCVINPSAGSYVAVGHTEPEHPPGSRLPLLRLGWVGRCVQVYPDDLRSGSVSVYSCDQAASLLRTFDLPATGWGADWTVAPSGEVLLRYLDYNTTRHLSLWRPASGVPSLLDTKGCAGIKKLVIWSASSSAFLVRTAQTAVSIFSSQGQLLHQPQDVGLHPDRGAWGHTGLALADDRHELRLYVVQQDHALVLSRVLLGRFGFPQFSPCGAHVAVTSCVMESRVVLGVRCRGILTVVRIKDGAVLEWDDVTNADGWHDESCIGCATSRELHSAFLCFAQD